jgi:hypothetical protein
MRKAYNAVIAKPYGKRKFVRPRLRCKDNSKMILQNYGVRILTESNCLKLTNEWTFGFRKGGGYFDQLSKYKVKK